MDIRWKAVRVDKSGVYTSVVAFSADRYNIIYPKEVGTVVSAIPHTLGIMVFEKKVQVYSFFKQMCSNFPMKILKVEGIGVGKRPKQIARLFCRRNMEETLDLFYHDALGVGGPPAGTVCYQKIKILDEGVWYEKY